MISFEKFPLFSISLSDKEYPELLKKCSTAPKVLYCRGEKGLLNQRVVAIVGSRTATDYGKENAFCFAADLSRGDLVIVSGIAKGIDSFAHQGSLSKNGKTIAVLATSIEEKTFYPKENLEIAKKILLSGGLLVSEYNLGAKTEKYNFAQRNRIVAGLSEAVLIVEAKEKSGALLTAKFAQKFKRALFALPGQIGQKNYYGCHQLIKQGSAKLTDNSGDIFDFLKIKKNLSFCQTKSDSPEKEQIKKILIQSPKSINQIIKQSGLAPEKVSAILTLMEIEGEIKDLGGNVYCLPNKINYY